MLQDFTLLEAMPEVIAPDVLRDMPIPMICFNSSLEALYFNAAFASYVELDNTDASLLVGIGTLQAMDFMPEYQPDGLHSIDTLHKFIEKASKQGIYQYPWMLQSLNGKPIATQMAIVVNVGISNLYINCYFLYTVEGTNSIQIPRSSFPARPLTTVTSPAREIKKPVEPGIDKEFEHDILEALPLIMHIWSKDLQLVDCSAQVVDFFGLNSKDEFKEKFFTLCPELQRGKNSAELMKEYLQKALDEGFCKFKWLHSDTKGKILPCEVTFARVNHLGEECVLGYTQDLSMVSSHVQEFAKVQESTRAMLDSAPMAIVLWDKSFNMRDANAESVRLFGFESRDDFVHNFAKCAPKFQENGERSLTVVQNALTEAFEKSYFRSDFSLHHLPSGRLIPLEITLVRLDIWNEEVVAAYIRDMTDLREFINEMRSTEERIQTIFDITPLGINVWDHTFNLIECNDAIVKMYGFESKKAYFPARYRIVPRLQPDGTPTIPLARNSIQEAFDTGQSFLEMLTYDVHGNPIPVETISKRAHVQGQDVVISYVRDLRDLKAMLAEIATVEQELRTARDIAEQSAQAKSEFLGNISHEIRTPLNGVLGLLHVLDATALQPIQKDYVGKSIFSAESLLSVVNNILDFSKIDAGTFEMHSEPFTLNEIIDEVRLVYEPQIRAKKLAFNVHVNDSHEKILYGDAARLKQIFSNVMSNAIRFTHKGFITLNVSCTEEQRNGAHYLFSVEDSGEGMTKMQSLQVFSAFTQGDSSLTRKHGGTGLGLAIAKRIAKLMNGDMWVKTEKDKGSTFYFTAIFGFDTEKSIALSNTAAENDAVGFAEASNAQEENMQETAGSILLVEDNEINQLIIIELLKNKGHSVDVAIHGKQAIEMLEKKDYDMVFMDIQMPVMDGLTATAHIRAQQKFAHLPIVAMSAHGMTSHKEISLQHGMNDHLTKPIVPSILYTSVAKWVGKKTS